LRIGPEQMVLLPRTVYRRKGGRARGPTGSQFPTVDQASKMVTKEIERKFLVRNDGWRRCATAASDFRQGYLTPRRDGTSVRVRLIDGVDARLTLKFARLGLTRDEFEYDIPLEEAYQLLEHTVGNVIEKMRYTVPYRSFVWEVDVFGGVCCGLIIAEVEMSSEDDKPSLPGWLGREVTGDKRYSNRTLATQTDGSLAVGRIRFDATPQGRPITDPIR
jgi:CYTH domain-containing protein